MTGLGAGCGGVGPGCVNVVCCSGGHPYGWPRTGAGMHVAPLRPVRCAVLLAGLPQTRALRGLTPAQLAACRDREYVASMTATTMAAFSHVPDVRHALCAASCKACRGLIPERCLVCVACELGHTACSFVLSQQTALNLTPCYARADASLDTARSLSGRASAACRSSSWSWHLVDAVFLDRHRMVSFPAVSSFDGAVYSHPFVACCCCTQITGGRKRAQVRARQLRSCARIRRGRACPFAQLPDTIVIS